MQSWVRLGMFALPCSGLLGTISILLPGVFIDPSVDPRGFAQASGSIGLGNMLGIVALVLWLVGIQALYSFLAGMSVRRWALVALIFSFAGIGLFLPLAGILAFAAPVAGRAYLNGDKNAISLIADSIALSNPSALLFGGFVGSTVYRRLNHIRTRNMALSRITKMDRNHLCCCRNAFFLERPSLQLHCRPPRGLATSDRRRMDFC